MNKFKDLLNWHPVFQNLSIAAQHFKRCVNLRVLKLPTFLKAKS